MAARRGRSQARRTSSNGLPGWAWLVIGVVLTLLAVLLVPRLLKPSSGDGFLRVGPTPNPDARPAPASGDVIAPDVTGDGPTAGATTAAPKPQKFDFYTLLPGEGVPMTDAELAASAAAEAQSETGAPSTPEDSAAAIDGALPPPIDEGAAKATVAAPVPAPASAAAEDSPPGSARYLLQAGAFGASGDAEAVKARIALLGLSARVESARVGDRTVYRVRMGPYGTASELAEAKAKLARGGLPAMAIKAR